MDCYYLFLFICLLIWEKVSDSLELCSRGWSQILDSPDPPGTGITDVCQHTWIRVKFTEPFFVCLEENEPRCFCFCFVVCSFLYLKFSLTSLACEICKPHTTAVNHFIGFLSWSVLSQLTSTLLGLYSSQHKEPPPTWHTQAHYNCMLAYKGVLWHLFTALKGLWILHVMLLWMRAIFGTSNKTVLTSSSSVFFSHWWWVVYEVEFWLQMSLHFWWLGNITKRISEFFMM